MHLPSWPNLCFSTIALLASFLIGWNCFEIFAPDWWWGLSLEERKKKWKLHWFQRWFNFAGSLLGWAVLWLLLRRVWMTYISAANPGALTLLDLLGAMVALIGITGWLPRTVMGFITSFERIFEKFAEKIAE
jgi:hypothetical protein